MRKVKVYGDPRRVLSLHSIVVQSPLLKDLLADVLADYSGVTVGLHRLEFHGKFEPLIHRWPQLTAAIAKLKTDADEEGAEELAVDRLEHAKLFYDLLKEEFQDNIDGSRDMIAKGVITYDLLWTAFQPRCFLYAKIQGHERILRLQSSSYGKDHNENPCYWLTCEYVDYDGTNFGISRTMLNITAYEGMQDPHAAGGSN